MMMNTSEKKSTQPDITNWESINWLSIGKYVEKLQQRIYHAECLKQSRKVRDLQRLLMNSKASLLLSIRRVTQLNKGKRTSGVDKYKALLPSERMSLYMEMKEQNIKLHNPKPAYRTYIQKKNGKRRPLGIPTIRDRVRQNIVKLALEPQWEAKFEPSSYGFRPKRNCHDAMERIFNIAKGGKKQWIFEGDFRECFDKLNHDFILEQIKGFPAFEAIRKWLKAGFLDNDVFNETPHGVPQGGIISPLLANIALHGMESHLGITYKAVQRKDKKTTYECRSSLMVVRYADDFVIFCESETQAKGLYHTLSPYLIKRGLELAEDKTKITNINEGFDFLGFNTKKYNTQHKTKILIKPSRSSIKTFKRKVKVEAKSLNGQNIGAFIVRVNPILIGTANYWKSSVAKEIFQYVDYYIWKITYRFLKRLHPKKPWKWITKRYFKPDKTGQSKSKWILTDPISGGQLKKMAWTPIERHVPIIYNYSLFNKELLGYFKRRDIKDFNRNNVAYRQKLAKKQKYKCSLCTYSIADFSEELETHHKIPKIKGGSDEYRNLQLVHNSCHILHHRLFPAKGPVPTDKQLLAAKKYLYKNQTGRTGN
jgi:RNA-directed DNA polymerase